MRLIADLSWALAQLGLPASVSPSSERGSRDPIGARGVSLTLDGQTYALRPVFVSEPAQIDLDAVDPAKGDEPSPPRELAIVVAPGIPDADAARLRAAGCGWLGVDDGRLRLWSDDLRIDTSVVPRSRPRDDAVSHDMSGPGLAIALRLLIRDEHEADPASIARSTGHPLDLVHGLWKTWAASGLIRADGEPVGRSLFDAVVEGWRPAWRPLRSIPPISALEGWVRTGAQAAHDLGLALHGDPAAPGRPQFYAPSRAALDDVLARFAPVAASPPGDPSAGGPTARTAAYVAEAPDPAVMSWALTLQGSPMPITHPVVVALDIASASPHGRAAIDGWTPSSALATVRVW